MFKNFKVDNARRVEFEGSDIQISGSKWAYLRNLKVYGNSDGVSSFNLTSCGENLWDSKGMFDDLNVADDNAFTYETFDGKNCIKVQEPNSNAATLHFNYGFKENTQYRIKYDFYHNLISTSYSGIYFLIYYTDGTYRSLGWTITANTWLSIDYITTVDKTVDYIRITYSSALNYTYFDLDTFQITEGTDDTTYTAYNGTTYPYRIEDTNGNLLTMYDGDYYDRDNNIAVISGTTYNIKPYSFTFLYNQKPIQAESDEANVFTDTNATLKFKAVSYGE